MKDLAKRFLSETDKKKITNAVEEAEKHTSGEIVPMIVSASYHYPMANVIGGAAFAIPVSLILSSIVGEWLWIGSQNMWLFTGFLFAVFIVFHEIIKRALKLKRIFISQQEINEEVEEAAITSFLKKNCTEQGMKQVF